MSYFIINDASHVAKNTINSLKNYRHFDASKCAQFSSSDIKHCVLMVKKEQLLKLLLY